MTDLGTYNKSSPAQHPIIFEKLNAGLSEESEPIRPSRGNHPQDSRGCRLQYNLGLQACTFRDHPCYIMLPVTFRGQTCRWVYDIISRSISLRYILELAANGMQHGSHFPSLGKMQCLEMLIAHEAPWRTLLWTGSTSVDALIGWGEPVSVSGNVLCFRTISGKTRKELLLLRAPSKLRNVVGKTWRIQLPHDTQDVCIDAAQDLLICRWCVTSICITPSSSSLPPHSRFKSFRVCSLSSGRSHPLARHVGVIDTTSTWRYHIGSMRVCGDNFAVACEEGLYISVWNWKSGEHISDFVRSLISE